jgi:outer membrane protein assembly factor BamB
MATSAAAVLIKMGFSSSSVLKPMLLLLTLYVSIIGSLVAQSGLYRGDAQRTGRLSGDPITAQPETLWTRAIGPASLGGPVLYAGTLYVPTQRNGLFALNAREGSLRWRAPDIGFGSPVAIADGIVYVGSANGKLGTLSALEAGSGQRAWAVPLPSPVYTAPLIIGENLYVVTGDGTLWCMNRHTGHERWRVVGGQRSVLAAPAADDSGIVFAAGDTILAVSPEDGRIRWRLAGGRWWSGLAVDRGRLLAGNLDGTFVAINAATGRVIWRAVAAGAAWSAPAVGSGMAFVGNEDHYLYAFDELSGALRWKTQLDDDALSHPILIKDALYLGTGNHDNRVGQRHLYAIRAIDGQVTWRVPTPERVLTSPAYSDGILAVVTISGALIVLR